MTVLLSCENVSKFFGGVKAVKNISLEVNPGEIVSLIGPNGAGKTTLFNVITGMYEPTDGTVYLGRGDSPLDITGKKSHKVAEKGISRTYQNIRLFNQLPSIENVRVGMHTRTERPFARSMGTFIVFWMNTYGVWLCGGALTAILYVFCIGLAGFLEYAYIRRSRGRPITPKARLIVDLVIFILGAVAFILLLRHFIAGEPPAQHWWPFVLPLIYTFYLCGRSWSAGIHDDDEQTLAHRYLDFVGLDGLEYELADNLPYGLKRRLEIARALGSKPFLLLLDEPAAGMNPVETENLMKLIRKIRDAGLTVFLIEHDMRVVMGISDRVYVLDNGELIAHGTPEEVQGNPRVVEAYLGRET
ncbi:MAG: ABC transporter ATP-binding protein [Planctomycetota bacterium]|nr:MAG: ABC transporter ATP-binding protein [Planctomycetota bacterium]